MLDNTNSTALVVISLNSFWNDNPTSFVAKTSLRQTWGPRSATYKYISIDFLHTLLP